MLESAGAAIPRACRSQLHYHIRIDIFEQHLVRDTDAFGCQHRPEGRDFFLNALVIGRQGIDKVVRDVARRPPTISRTVIMPVHHDQNRSDGWNAFPLEPEYRRRPEHCEKNGDQEDIRTYCAWLMPAMIITSAATMMRKRIPRCELLVFVMD